MGTYISPDEAVRAAFPSARRRKGWLSSGIRTAHNADVLLLDESAAPLATGQSGEGGAGDTPIEGASDQSLWRYAVAACGVLLVAGACLLISHKVSDAAYLAQKAPPVDGLTIFAVFFVAALAIERLLEPLSNALLPTSDKKKNAEKAAEAAGKSVVSARKGQSQLATLNAIKREFDSGAITLDTVVNEAERLPLPNLKPLLTASRAPTPDIDAVKTELTNAVTASKGVVEKDNGKANDALKTAAVEGERLRVRQLTRTTAFWVLATVIGMLAAATMKLYFLNTVGITAGARWQEILATGLILGAGTQPLHSLTTLITKKAEKKEDEPGDDS